MCKAWPSFFLLHVVKFDFRCIFCTLIKAKMKMSLTVLTVSRVQTENDHLSPMEEWNVTNYKRKKEEKIYTGPRTTLYMYEWKTWYVAKTELSFCIDKLCMNLWYLPTKISDCHLKSAKKISNETLPNLLACKLYTYLLYSTNQAIPYVFYYNYN